MLYFDNMTIEEKQFILENKHNVKKVYCSQFCQHTHKVVLCMKDKIVNKLYLTNILRKLF